LYTAFAPSPLDANVWLDSRTLTAYVAAASLLSLGAYAVARTKFVQRFRAHLSSYAPLADEDTTAPSLVQSHGGLVIFSHQVAKSLATTASAALTLYTTIKTGQDGSVADIGITAAAVRTFNYSMLAYFIHLRNFLDICCFIAPRVSLPPYACLSRRLCSWHVRPAGHSNIVRLPRCLATAHIHPPAN
jgi:hypothetical protein